MRKILIATLIIIVLTVLVGLSFVLVKILRPKVAGLFIESIPVSKVYVNGQDVGSTPYRSKTLDPGQVAIRLVPLDESPGLVPFDTKVTLTANIETVLRREFGKSEEFSSTELISFEKTAKNETSVTVVTIPSDAQLLIDGEIKAFTPYKTSSLAGGDHRAQINLEGFVNKEINFKTHEGFRLVVYLVLKKSEDVAAVVTPTPVLEVFVEILTTPTGFLRVRKEPSTAAVEVAQVDSGRSYKLVGEDTETGWFKIEYQDGLVGWISNQFAKKLDVNEVVPTPSPEF